MSSRSPSLSRPLGLATLLATAVFASLTAVTPASIAQEPPGPADAPAAVESDAPGAPAAAPTGVTWRTVADLVVGVHRSHACDPGPVLRFDDGGAYKYLDFHRHRPWTERFYSRQHGYATLVRGKRARLRFPATARDCLGGCVLALGLYSTTNENVVHPTLNGTKLGSETIGDRWAAVRFEVPPGTLRDGENELTLAFDRAKTWGPDRHAAGLRYVRFDPPGTRWSKPALPGRVGVVKTSTGDVPALWRAERTSWYLLLPTRAHLDLAAVANARSEAELSVVATDALTGVSHVLLPPRRADADAETELTVDLTPVAGRPVRLDLVWSGRGVAGVTRAQIQVPESPSAAREAGSPLARNVVVWAIDTLRADETRIYDPQAAVEQPNLEAFARGGVVFTPGVAAGAHSLPSHASMLLGQQPTTHQVYVGDDRIAPTQTLVSEYVQMAGIRTALISSNGYVSDRWGFDQGWSFQTNLLREGKGGTCENVVRAVDTFLEGNAGQRFFLYLVPVEPHVPYRYREGVTERYDAEPTYSGRYQKSVTGKDLGAIRGGRAVSERDRARIKALYRGEVAHADVCFGALLEVLRKRGISEDTAVIVVSDHGDELFDRGGVGHAHSVHQEVVNVPFVVALPGRGLRGATRTEGAGHTDLAPTVLDLLGVPAPEDGLQGQSLVPLLIDATPGLPAAHVANHGVVKKSLQLGPLALIVDWEGKELLFDHAADPKETTDVGATRPLAARLMRDVMGFWWKEERRWKTAWGNPAFPASAFKEWLDGGWTPWKKKRPKK